MDENVVSTQLIDAEQLDKINKALKGIVDTTDARPIDKFCYAQPFDGSKYKLLEVTEELAAHVLEGKELYLSGFPDDALILRTDSKAYRAKEVERSNSMMLTNMTAVPKNVDEAVFREFKVFSVLMRNISLDEKSG